LKGLWSSVAIRLLVLWGAFIVYGTTIPFDMHPGLWTLSQGWKDAHKIPWVDPEGGMASLSDALTNVLLFLPWGFLVAVHVASRGGSARAAIVASGLSAFCMSLGVEMLQLLSTTRIASATDLVNNTAGGTLGGAIGWIAAGRGRSALGPRFTSLREREPLTLLALAVAGGVLLSAVAPFDLSLDVGDVKASVKRARPVPFGAPIRGDAPEPRPGKAAATLLAWSAIGGVLALAHRGRGGARPAAVGAAGVLILSSLAELAQLFVRSRTADATTVAWAVAGGAAGAVLVASRADRAPRDWIPTAIAAWLAATVASGLEPWRFSLAHRGSIGWVPFEIYFERTDAYALADAMMQIVRYAPLGLLLAARAPGSGLGRAGAAGAIVAGLVEVGQVFLPDRVADVTDVVLGGAGAAFGAWVLGRAAPVPGLEVRIAHLRSSAG
jgi:VanZ family protein